MGSTPAARTIYFQAIFDRTSHFPQISAQSETMKTKIPSEWPVKVRNKFVLIHRGERQMPEKRLSLRVNKIRSRPLVEAASYAGWVSVWNYFISRDANSSSFLNCSLRLPSSS